MPRNYIVSLIGNGLPTTALPQLFTVYAEDNAQAIEMANYVATRLNAEFAGSGVKVVVDFVEVIL